jgi:hypothetical protein
LFVCLEFDFFYFDLMEHSNRIIRLNIGGKIFQTTETTLLSHGPNFFTGLLAKEIPSTMDETGAYFIDRNGRLFEPILDYLRTNILIVPPTMSLEAILFESAFYCIEASKGLCQILPGLYSSADTPGVTSSDEQSWLLLVQRDESRPTLVGVTGVFDDEMVLEQACPLLPGGTIDLIRKRTVLDSSGNKIEHNFHMHISLEKDDPTNKTLVCRDADRWSDPRRLIWRQDPSKSDDEFPLLDTTWIFSPDGKRKVRVKFEKSREGREDVLMRQMDMNGANSFLSVIPMCRSLYLVRGASCYVGLIYMSGGVVFFMEGEGENFSAHALKKIVIN